MHPDAAWAKRVAWMIIENHADAAAIDTADYRECSFILEAARLVLEDSSVAEHVGRRMEPPRRD